MRPLTKILAPMVALLAAGGAALPAHAGSEPAQAALAESKGEVPPKYNAIQNRFFLKEKRFELSPIAGYVPNNPFAVRYVGGVLAAYHFSENLAAEGAFVYSPDLGTSDLKGLTHTLVGIATQEGSAEGVEFQQPVEKMILGATFAARWAPVYGKINLIGERVLNFDFYGVAGLGLLTVQEYYAKYDESVTPNPTRLDESVLKTKVPLNLGVGFDFFLSSSVALKIDARNYLYIDSKPQYDPEVPVEESRLYNNFIASVGVAIFMPKMKTRQYDF